MVEWADMRRLRHSVPLRHPSRLLHRCCDRQALPAPTTAQRRQATRLHRLHRRDTTRLRRRHNSTLPLRLAIRLLVLTIALPLLICMVQALLLHHILLLLLRGLRHPQRLTRQRVQASPKVLGRSNLQLALAIRPLHRHFLLGLLVRELQATNTHLIPQLTIDLSYNAYRAHFLPLVLSIYPFLYLRVFLSLSYCSHGGRLVRTSA